MRKSALFLSLPLWLLGRPDRSAQLYLLAGDGYPLSEARQRQLERFSATALTCNADTRSEQLGMSARSFHRVLKLARTIADLNTGRRSRKTYSCYNKTTTHVV